MSLASPLPHDSARSSQSQVSRPVLCMRVCIGGVPCCWPACTLTTAHGEVSSAHRHPRAVNASLLLQSNNAAPREPLAHSSSLNYPVFPVPFCLLATSRPQLATRCPRATMLPLLPHQLTPRSIQSIKYRSDGQHQRQRAACPPNEKLHLPAPRQITRATSYQHAGAQQHHAENCAIAQRTKRSTTLA
jgi:hypothetical protein